MANPIQQIEIDCAPGPVRPDAFYVNTIVGTGLPFREPTCKVFGCWTWDYSDLPLEVWERVTPILKERLTAFYLKGAIRFASW